jgi:non-canonical purine NTP pyrophosphatase (RdgB/HAM1 family)
MITESQSPSLLVGTRNSGKVREIQTILADVPWHIRSLLEFDGVEAPDETGDTYAANAIIKAEFYARATGICALADDSGLEVEALGGAPGVFSARYAGAGAADADRRRLLLSELAQVPNEQRQARFVCAVAIATPGGSVLNTSEGTCEGAIIFEPRGSGGFGYDPLFVPDGFKKTFAELSDAIKNQISHRARALLKTREFLLSNA